MSINIINVIKLAAWASLAFNVCGLIGSYMIAKALSDSKLFWLRAILDPDRTKKDAEAAARLAAGYLRRAAVSAVVLAVIYH